MILYKKPFKHWVNDEFVVPIRDMSRLLAAWPADGDPRWNKETGKGQIKWSMPVSDDMGALWAFYSDLNSDEFIGRISELTGIPELLSDPKQTGAGLHSIPPGGFLKMHTDFRYLPSGWRRRLNLLIYLSPAWRAVWGGALILGKPPASKTILPKAGRAVLFETTDSSWHGHPRPTLANIHRRSIAVYYYTKDNGVPDKTIYDLGVV